MSTSRPRSSLSPPRNREMSPKPASKAADDRIVGLAFKWSLVALFAIAAFAAAVVWYARRNAGTVRVGLANTPVSDAQLRAQIPDARFRDITEEGGIRFVHH